MDGPRDYCLKWKTPGKDKYHNILLTCGIKKIVQMNLFTNRNRPTDIENTLLTKGESGSGEG